MRCPNCGETSPVSVQLLPDLRTWQCRKFTNRNLVRTGCGHEWRVNGTRELEEATGERQGR